MFCLGLNASEATQQFHFSNHRADSRTLQGHFVTLFLLPTKLSQRILAYPITRWASIRNGGVTRRKAGAFTSQFF
jgi:hypothetical protein